MIQVTETNCKIVLNYTEGLWIYVAQKGVKKTIYLDKEALEQVAIDADEQDRSVSYIINAILKKHYNLDKKKQ